MGIAPRNGDIWNISWPHSIDRVKPNMAAIKFKMAAYVII